MPRLAPIAIACFMFNLASLFGWNLLVKFGVRMEDCFHMTDSGPKFFSTPPKSIDEPF